MVVPLCNKDDDDQIKFKTPLMQIGYGKYVPMNRVNEYMLVITSRLNSDVLCQQVFDKNELLQELYRSQKINLTMSLPNFTELMTLGLRHR